MKKISKQELVKLRKEYPIGCSVKLILMQDEQAPPQGSIGQVLFVDDIGTIHITWENGSFLGAILGVDKIEKI